MSPGKLFTPTVCEPGKGTLPPTSCPAPASKGHSEAPHRAVCGGCCSSPDTARAVHNLLNLTWWPQGGVCVCETLLTSKKMKMIWVQEFKAEEGKDHFNREGAAVHKVAIKYLSC